MLTALLPVLLVGRRGRGPGSDRAALAVGRAHSWRVNLWQRIRTFDGATANLAVAAALLSVWEARQEAS